MSLPLVGSPQTQGIPGPTVCSPTRSWERGKRERFLLHRERLYLPQFEINTKEGHMQILLLAILVSYYF